MKAQDVRRKYLEKLKNDGHVVIDRVSLVPQNDPTTLFTNSGMQPLLPYLLGEDHPEGTRLTDSQTCFRADDIDDVGDNRHTTFFEMLGNWSLGDYFKEEQIPRFFNFLVNDIGLDPSRIYATCFIGDRENNIPKDEDAARIWRNVFRDHGIEAEIKEMGSAEDGARKGMGEARIFYYDAGENWWSRAGAPGKMPAGEPGGPDSEVFYRFNDIDHDTKYGEHCQPACDCGRFIELGNSVFMEYVKQQDGSFAKLPKQNVDYGGGLERITAAAIDSPDVYKISIMWPIVEALQDKSGKKYEDYTQSMRVITDHLRGATWLAIDGVVPSNHQQGYVLRRILRRAVRYAMELGIEADLTDMIVPIVVDMFKDDYPEFKDRGQHVANVLSKEEQLFRQTLKAGVKHFCKEVTDELTGEIAFKLYDTYGFPYELSIEEAEKNNIHLSETLKADFDSCIEEQRIRSRTASKGQFKGGLEGTNPMHVKYHTTTHVMYRALRHVLGDHVEQRGSNITEERTRFDFNHHEKLTDAQIKEVEDIVNKVIDDDLPVTWEEMPTQKALKSGARGHFGEKYGAISKVYIIGPKDSPYSMELCGGPHVEHTGLLGEDGKRFKILKEQSSSAGIRRIKAALV